MALFPTNAEVSKFNESVVEKKGLDIVVIDAEDTVATKRRRPEDGGKKDKTSVFARPYQRAEFDLADHPLAARKSRARKQASDGEFDANQAGGLMKTLRLAVNGWMHIQLSFSISNDTHRDGSVVLNYSASDASPQHAP